MGLPLLPARGGPGPELRRPHPPAAVPTRPLLPASADHRPGRGPGRCAHGTTVVALRFADGVVMAGDRRATEGNVIAHRAMEKVFPADRHSAVAIAGAAGPAVEMVKLFQTQLEHYEKVEGVALSLEGKANQLGQMVREHLPMAMQGLVVVPLFAGYDLRLRRGPHLHLRRHRRALRGDRLTPPRARAGATPAPPSSSAGAPSLGRDDGVELAVGPCTRRPTRTRPPAGPTSSGASTPWWPRSPPRATSVSPTPRWPSSFTRPGAAAQSRARHRRWRLMTMPFYVAPEQVMKDRAEYAQKGIARGRSLVASVYDDGILIVAENPSRSLHKVSEIYDRIAFAGVGKYNEFDQLRVAGVRHADTKGYAFSREDVDARSLANLYAQFLGQVFTHEMKPLEVEILVAELGVDGKPDQLFHIAYEGTITDEDRFAVLGGETETIADRLAEAVPGRLGSRRRAAGRGGAPWPGPTGPSSPTTSRWPCWPGPTAAGPFAGWATTSWPSS